ncbi:MULTISPECIES: MAE_28990/MAE_18760 family HEPN-like nuclease [Serratia]|uniref:MAE_28990/MAE_18760 family HEPN-like nuclease n=1 Tax=Serratia TaxID=613 RepID=UPI00146EF1D6|nr:MULTISPECIES: MAE_28990/MAE_18760 family HEPN-like nuclease [Serratia]MBJ2088593.1 hypothetical protein [Serratia ureilytica]NMU40539.1 hypothetical protein [Serratia marcescens]QQU64882.1 hypothetical protein I6I46_08990 [Serratia ureilytica]UNE45839.1 hypothetical protein IHE77_10230 [Serratia ureilytica]CAI2402123.1 Uncharacterised protein [Serratia marcescens]
MIREKKEFNIRDEEIKKIIKLISLIEVNSIVVGNETELDIVKTNPILKASTMLALYNIVESTISNLLDYIHDSLCSKNLSFDDINNDIQNLYITYHYKFKSKKKDDIHQFAGLINDTIKLITGKKIFNLKYKKMSEHYSIYSGNLDTKKIRTTFGKYGMHLPYLKYSDGRVLKSNSEEINAFQNDNNEKSIVGYSLNTIMKVRNKLAHGDLSFEEYGRSLVTDDLEKYYKDALFFLRMVILKVNYFISKEKYKP